MFEASISDRNGNTEIVGTHATEQLAHTALGMWMVKHPRADVVALVREFDPYADAVDKIVAELGYKPDAHALLEWIDQTIPATTDPLLGGILTAINTYFVALDEQD